MAARKLTDKELDAFARQAKAARKARVPKMTQAELGAAVDASERTILNFEAGKRIRPSTIDAIRDVLGLSDESAEAAPPQQPQPMDFCPTCDQLVVPIADRSFFHVLAGYMARMTPEQKVAFVHRVLSREVLS